MLFFSLPVSASAILGLTAALTWGGGDFSGGMGVKAAGSSPRAALKVILSGHSLSWLVLAALCVLTHAPKPAGTPVFWGLGAGVAAGLSITVFYVALARGAMGASAAISGLLAAALPAIVAWFVDGFPGWTRLFGFALAAVAIWLIAAPPDAASAAPDPVILLMAVSGGVGFGVYFIALRFANPLGPVLPLLLARTGSILTCLGLLPFLREPNQSNGNSTHSASRPGTLPPTSRWLPRPAWLWAVGVAVLDTAGNAAYLGATRSGRLDVAAVLASLYPASTILLAALLLGERPTRWQLGGMLTAALAVALITL